MIILYTFDIFWLLFSIHLFFISFFSYLKEFEDNEKSNKSGNSRIMYCDPKTMAIFELGCGSMRVLLNVMEIDFTFSSLLSNLLVYVHFNALRLLSIV